LDIRKNNHIFAKNDKDMDENLRKRMEAREERRKVLMGKPISDLIDTILFLEEENAKAKEWRSKLIKIRNIITPEGEKRSQGRPRKEEEKDFI